jgi:hypothetical protein
MEGEINVIQTEAGFTIHIQKEEVEDWKNVFVQYFNQLNEYEVTTRSLKTSEQISVRLRKNIKKKKKEFVVSLYKNGTMLIQTIKKDDFLNHWNKIIKSTDVRVLDLETENEKKDKDKEKEEFTTNEMLDEEDQRSFNKNIEEHVMKMMRLIDNNNNQIEQLNKNLTNLKSENDGLRAEKEKK